MQRNRCRRLIRSGKKKRPYIAFGFGSRLFFYPKNFTARRKAIFVRRMNKTNITCGYSDAINRDVREGVLSLLNRREIQEEKESFPPPRPWFVYLSSFPCFELCFFFLKRGKKGKKKKIKRDKGQRSCSPRSCHRQTEEFE